MNLSQHGLRIEGRTLYTEGRPGYQFRVISPKGCEVTTPTGEMFMLPDVEELEGPVSTSGAGTVGIILD